VLSIFPGHGDSSAFETLVRPGELLRRKLFDPFVFVGPEIWHYLTTTDSNQPVGQKYWGTIIGFVNFVA
jgi:hypothetical protein